MRSGAGAAGQLSDEELAVVLLARQPGMTYRDVARITGFPPAAVLRALRTGLSKLRASLPEPAPVG